MRIAVVGPGAMGCLFGAFLARAGEDVILLDHDPDRARAIAAEGIRIEGISGEHRVAVPVVADPAHVGDVELALVCVKSYSTPEAARILGRCLGPHAAALTLQNGLGNVEILAEELGPERVLCGVTAEGATRLAPGRIRHAGRGTTAIGSATGEIDDRLRRVVAILHRAGFETDLARDIESRIWGKLIVNVGINALTALLRVRNGELLRNVEARGLMRAAVEEAVEVARGRGMALPFDDAVAHVEGVARATAGNISSMLQDVLRGRRTEIDAIQGAIVAKGADRGIETPANRALRDLVKALEGTYPARVNP